MMFYKVTTNVHVLLYMIHMTIHMQYGCWSMFEKTIRPPWPHYRLHKVNGSWAGWSLILHQFPRKSHQNATRINTNLQSLQVQIIWGFIWVSASYTKYLMQIYALDMDHCQGSMLWWSQNPMMPRCQGVVLGWNLCFFLSENEYESIMST